MKDKKIFGWILKSDANKASFEINSFIEHGKDHDIEFEAYDATDFDILIGDSKAILIRGERRELPDFVLPRMGANTNYIGLSIIRHFEKMGILVINSSNSIDISRDKFYTLLTLSDSNLPIPKTILLKHPVKVDLITNEIKYPIILKTLSGMQGKGVFLANDKREFNNYIDILEETAPSANMIIQEFIKSSYGTDLRVFVIGGVVAGCMKRTGSEGNFKANITGGGTGEKFDLDENAKMIALEATRIIGLDIAGVDLLFDINGQYKICEINSSPGFKGLNQATGQNIAINIIKYIKVKLGIFE